MIGKRERLVSTDPSPPPAAFAAAFEFVERAPGRGARMVLVRFAHSLQSRAQKNLADTVIQRSARVFCGGPRKSAEHSHDLSGHERSIPLEDNPSFQAPSLEAAIESSWYCRPARRQSACSRMAAAAAGAAREIFRSRTP